MSAEPDYSLVSMRAGVCSGRPCVKRTRILAEVVAARWLAGESIGMIAILYRPGMPALTLSRHIEQAIRFVLWHRTKRRKLPKAGE